MSIMFLLLLSLAETDNTEEQLAFPHQLKRSRPTGFNVKAKVMVFNESLRTIR